MFMNFNVIERKELKTIGEDWTQLGLLKEVESLILLTHITQYLICLDILVHLTRTQVRTYTSRSS